MILNQIENGNARTENIRTSFTGSCFHSSKSNNFQFLKLQSSESEMRPARVIVISYFLAPANYIVQMQKEKQLLSRNRFNSSTKVNRSYESTNVTCDCCWQSMKSCY